MKRFLVGYSADKGGCEALRLAAMLARSAGGRVIVAVILPETWDHPSPAMVDVEYAQFLERHAEKTLQQARAEMPVGIMAEFLHHHAATASAGLLALARDMAADAIVLGSSRKAPMARFQEGTVASEILRSAQVPVALAPRGYVAPDAGLSRITCAISASGHSLALAHEAGRIAEGFHVPLRLATFIVRDRQMYPSGAGYDVENMVSNKFRAQALAVHDQIRAAWDSPLPPQSGLGDGRTWKEAVADLTWQPDEMLVIGSSRLGGLLRVFVGSNSGKVLRHAPVPRMIVPRITE